jgi:hypothetical protein
MDLFLGRPVHVPPRVPPCLERGDEELQGEVMGRWHWFGQRLGDGCCDRRLIGMCCSEGEGFACERLGDFCPKGDFLLCHGRIGRLSSAEYIFLTARSKSM